jgi:hypothetical protein
MDKITYNHDRKFDLQLSAALIHERRLGDIFAAGKIEKIELKSETWQWEQTGNIAIEFACGGKPSGIATTEADYWVHELRRDDDTLVYLMFPVDRLKALARDAYRRGQYRVGVGDDGRFDVALISLAEILR